MVAVSSEWAEKWIQRGRRQREREYVWPGQTVHGQRTGVVLRPSTEQVLKGRETGKEEKVSSRRQVRNIPERAKVDSVSGCWYSIGQEKSQESG